MDIAASRDVTDFLNIKNILITCRASDYPCLLISVSQTHIVCIIPDSLLSEIKSVSTVIHRLEYPSRQKLYKWLSERKISI